MPGRPRTTLRHLDDVIERTLSISDEMLHLTPECYLSQPDASNQMCVAWYLARESTMESLRALGTLRELVAAKVERAERRGR